MKEVKAQLNNYRASPRKVRVVANLVAGKKVKDALTQLAFLAKKSSTPVAKLIKSAINNAKNNFKVQNEDALKVKKITVDPGPILKRIRPRSRGMANRINKRTSRITVVLSE
ncbi:MAG: 50S ribosomal protein L22 [Candidatus Pacebacteria bacterium]|nr:50S ribosomal protein L22 [Candidatus Paceibacterota bacterium]